MNLNVSSATLSLRLTVGENERGVGCHLLDVDVRCVQEDIVLSTKTGENCSDAGNELCKRGPPLWFGVPALNHGVIPVGNEETFLVS